MAVDDVVAVADPVNVDRWQLAAFDHGGVHARPAIAQTPGGGQETGEEIARLGGRPRPHRRAPATHNLRTPPPPRPPPSPPSQTPPAAHARPPPSPPPQ